MEKTEKVFLSTQLNCMLPCLAVKVLNYLLSWQSQGSTRYYEKQFSKFLHLTVNEVETGIQTLIDNNLLSATLIDQTWILSLNRETIQKYFKVPMQKVHDHEGFKLAEKIVWNKTEKELEEIATEESDIWAEMSTEQLKRLIDKIQEEIDNKENTVPPEHTANDLPF